jgi:uncharacterized protein YycO
MKGLPEAILGMTIVAGWACLALWPEQQLASLKTLELAHSVSREILKGHLDGKFQGQPNDADFSQLEPGDVLLGHSQDGAYGFWTHAAIYVGNGNIVDAVDFPKGTVSRDVFVYRNFDDVEFLRLHADKKVRSRIAQHAIKQVGKPYSLSSSLNDSHSFYCSKLIWFLCQQEGVVLCQPRTWVLPDDLSNSDQFIQVGRWQARSSRGENKHDGEVSV